MYVIVTDGKVISFRLHKLWEPSVSSVMNSFINFQLMFYPLGGNSD